MKIKTQFILSILVFGMLIVAMSASAIIIQQRVNRIVNQENTVNSISQEANDLSYLGDNYMIYQESQQLSAWQNEFTTFSNDVGKLQGNTTEEKSLISNIRADVPQLKGVFDSVVSGLGSQSLNPGGAINNTIFQISWGRMSVQNQELASDSANLSQLFDTQANRTRQFSIIILIALIALFGVYFLLNYLMIERRTLKSIAKLRAGTVALGSGNLDFKIEEKENDEVGELSHAFNVMSSNLKNVTASKVDLEREIHERKKVEESLRESETRYRMLFENMSEGFALCEMEYDADGKPIDYRFINVNPVMEKFIGLPRDQIIGKTIRTIVPNVQNKAIENFGRVALTGEQVHFENFSRDLNRWFDIYAYQIKPGQFGFMILDIDDRKRADDTIKTTLDRFYTILSKMPLGILLVTKDGLTEFANQTFCDMFNLRQSPEEVKNLAAREIIEKIKNVYANPEQAVARIEEIVNQDELVKDEDVHLQGGRTVLRDFVPIRLGENTYGRLWIHRDITERQNIENALRVSEAKANALIKYAPTGIYELDYRTQRFISINDAMSSLTGYTKEELFAIGPGALLEEDSRKIFTTRTRRQLAGEKIDDSVEYRVKKKDGSTLWITLNIAFSADNPDIALVIGHDVTERIEAGKKLKESEEKYRELFVNMTEGFALCDMILDGEGKPADYRVLEANRAWENMTGLSFNQIAGKPLKQMIPGLEQYWVDSYGKVALTGEPLHLENYNQFTDRWYDIHAYSPRKGYFVSLVSNITERKKVEEKLKDSQKQLLDIIDGAPNSIFVKDLQGRFITINAQLEKLLGLTREEIKGKTDYDIISRDQTDIYRDNDGRIAENDKAEEVEEEAELADGKRHYFLANKFPLHDIHGKTYAVASVSTDITDLRRIEKAVRESEEKFATIFRSSPVGMVMTRLPDGHCVDVNEAYLKMLEYSREEVIGRDSRDLNMHVDPNRRAEVFRLLHEQGKVTNIELRFRTKTGRVIEMLSSIDKINLQGQEYSLSTNIDITQRKRAEAEIIHLASFPELNPSPVLEVEPDGTVIYANPAAKTHFPLMTQGLKHQFLMDFINSLKKAETESFTKDVKIGEHWYEETLAFVSSTKNYMLYARDITERKNAEVALQETRDYLNNLLNYANAPIIVWDSSFHITQFNHAFEYLTGRSAGDVIGESLDILFPEEQREHSMEHIRLTVAGERMEVEEIGIQHKDGSVRTVLWNSATLYDQDNQTPTATIAQGQDITERKKAEDALKASEEKYRNLFENMVEEVHFWKLVRDDDGEIKTWRLVDVNPPALRTWGRQTVDEIRGKTTDEIFGPGSTEHFMPVVQKIIMEGVPYAYEDYFPNLNKYFRFTSVPLGEYFITTGSDITEIKQNEESLSRYAHELEASNKELEAFSYSVSHDLRAPLRSITGFSTILLEDYREKLDDEGKLYLKKIEDSGELMGQLMDDLLKLSRVTRSDLNLQRLDLSDMAHKIVDELRKDEPNRKVKVTIAPNMTANGDKNLLGLVLQNLLGNAWKYSSKTSEPRIEMGIVEHNGKQAYFVRDNGVGFDMTYANKLFQPFQRLHKTTEFAGTGIGLATVQRIIRRHGGEVWAEAKVGDGATFYFTLS